MGREIVTGSGDYYVPADDSTRALHVNTKLDDPGLVGGRTWVFAQTGTTAGLITELRKRVYRGTTVIASDPFTWKQDDAGRWYIGTTASTQGSTTAKTDQTLDVYGNVTETKLYDWDGTVKRVHANRYYWVGMGRFMSPDGYPPFGAVRNPSGWNRYTYALGDPVNGFDPWGQLTIVGTVRSMKP